MDRFDIIQKIWKEYYTKNIEKWEFSYQQALQKKWKKIDKYFESWEKQHIYLDLRFAGNWLSILVETKNNSDNWNKAEIYKQLQDYVRLEKEYTWNKIIAIMANTDDDRNLVRYWEEINDENVVKHEKIKTFEEYKDFYYWVKNNKEKVIKSTYKLNEDLHKFWIWEKIRSQFVWTCLLALKNNLHYENLPTPQIIWWIQNTLSNLLDKNLNKAEKLAILNTKVMGSQDVRELKSEDFQNVLNTIKTEILPYINDKSTAGQDLLNLFFTTFNKYVGKTDKNQAFTPDHIVHFMCKVVWINRYSRVLDPCCWSWAFLVRAMVEAMNDCDTEEERNRIKKEQIYWMECEETAFWLSTTNMLIHGDWNSNIVNNSCFEDWGFIENANINVVLMNPPYNAQRKYSKKEYAETWKKDTITDPSKWFHYVYEIAKKVKTWKLAVLLPMSCAIWASADILKYKELMLNEHTLDAVFSLPNEMFYPWANVIVCCMVFNLWTRHKNSPNKKTFFWYFKDDWFTKRKYIWRIEKTDSNWVWLWHWIESYWLDLYRQRKSVPWISVTKKVSANDERLAETYMETDYSKLNEKDFQNVLNNYLWYLISNWKFSWEK